MIEILYLDFFCFESLSNCAVFLIFLLPESFDDDWAAMIDILLLLFVLNACFLFIGKHRECHGEMRSPHPQNQTCTYFLFEAFFFSFHAWFYDVFVVSPVCQLVAFCFLFYFLINLPSY